MFYSNNIAQPAVSLKRRPIEDIEASFNVKRFKNFENINPTTDTKVDFNCEFCSHTFANAGNLKQHVESFHIKTSTWECSECRKLFTSKSNLKVHLRVHTKIKPYHCKNCTYSCMHHSSIKEHLTRVHPGVVHSSTNPAYVYNSTAVPDPEQFNSATFNREAFIAEARHANEQLVAQINQQHKLSPSNSSSKVAKSTLLSSSISPKSSHSSPNLSINESDESSFNDEARLVKSTLVDMNNSTTTTTTKVNNFSISSLIGASDSVKTTTPNARFFADSTQQQNISTLMPTFANAYSSPNMWSYYNQIQLYFNYINHYNTNTHKF